MSSGSFGGAVDPDGGSSASARRGKRKAVIVLDGASDDDDCKLRVPGSGEGGSSSRSGGEVVLAEADAERLQRSDGMRASIQARPDGGKLWSVFVNSWRLFDGVTEETAAAMRLDRHRGMRVVLATGSYYPYPAPPPTRPWNAARTVRIVSVRQVDDAIIDDLIGLRPGGDAIGGSTIALEWMFRELIEASLDKKDWALPARASNGPDGSKEIPLQRRASDGPPAKGAEQTRNKRRTVGGVRLTRKERREDRRAWHMVIAKSNLLLRVALVLVEKLSNANGTCLICNAAIKGFLPSVPVICPDAMCMVRADLHLEGWSIGSQEVNVRRAKHMPCARDIESQVMNNGDTVDLVLDLLWMALHGGRPELGFPDVVHMDGRLAFRQLDGSEDVNKLKEVLSVMMSVSEMQACVARRRGGTNSAVSPPASSPSPANGATYGRGGAAVSAGGGGAGAAVNFAQQASAPTASGGLAALINLCQQASRPTGYGGGATRFPTPLVSIAPAPAPNNFNLFTAWSDGGGGPQVPLFTFSGGATATAATAAAAAAVAAAAAAAAAFNPAVSLAAVHAGDKIAGAATNTATQVSPSSYAQHGGALAGGALQPLLNSALGGVGGTGTGTVAPATSVPVTDVPGAVIPGTVVPGIVPGTGVPASGVAGAGVPGTGLPVTGIPVTGIPGTGIPNTDAPFTANPFDPRGGGAVAGGGGYAVIASTLSTSSRNSSSSSPCAYPYSCPPDHGRSAAAPLAIGGASLPTYCSAAGGGTSSGSGSAYPETARRSSSVIASGGTAGGPIDLAVGPGFHRDGGGVSSLAAAASGAAVSPISVEGSSQGRGEVQEVLVVEGKGAEEVIVVGEKKPPPGLEQDLNARHPLAYPLLRWALSGDRAFLRLLRPEDRIPEIVCEKQFMVVTGPEERESRFQALKEEARVKQGGTGSFYAFHGSKAGCWHGILSLGLKNMSATKYMTAASLGPGIYMANHLKTAIGYTREIPTSMAGIASTLQTSGANPHWPKARSQDPLVIVALLEVVDSSKRLSWLQHKEVYVVPDVECVATRYLLVNPTMACARSVLAANLTLTHSP